MPENAERPRVIIVEREVGNATPPHPFLILFALAITVSILWRLHRLECQALGTISPVA